MIWSELMAAVQRRGMTRAELARHLEVEESDLAHLEQLDGYVEGEIQAHILVTAHRYGQIIDADEVRRQGPYGPRDAPTDP